MNGWSFLYKTRSQDSRTRINIIKNILNTIDGVEVLKICSRYRFFIGVGKMFDFSEVRKNIEKELTNKGKNIE